MFVASKSKSLKLSQTIYKQDKKISYTQQNKLIQGISSRYLSQQRTTPWCFTHLMLRAKILTCLGARLLHKSIAQKSPMFGPLKRTATMTSIKSMWGCFPHCPSSVAAKVKAMNYQEQDAWIPHATWFWNPVQFMETHRLHRYHRPLSRRYLLEREKTALRMKLWRKFPSERCLMNRGCIRTSWDLCRIIYLQHLGMHSGCNSFSWELRSDAVRRLSRILTVFV